MLDRATLLFYPLLFYRHLQNIELCFNILLDNGYSLDLVLNIINKTLKFIFVNKARFLNNLNPTVENKKNLNSIKTDFLIIPFVKGSQK